MCTEFSLILTRAGKVLDGMGITESHTVIRELHGLKNTDDSVNAYEWQPPEGWPNADWNLGLTKDHEVFETKSSHEAAMERLQHDLLARWPPGHPDAPTGIVGMTVTESAHRPQTIEGRVSAYGPQVPVVEFTAVGTAIAPLLPNDPRRSAERPKPRIVVPLDR